MSKKACSTKTRTRVRASRSRRVIVMISLVLTLLGAGGVLARWSGNSALERHHDKKNSGEVETQGFTPGSPSKEYIYAGGRLIATEEPAGTPAAPPAPTGLAATPGNTQVSLTWNASSGATSYNLKRSTTNGGPYSTIAPGLGTTSYNNTGLTNGTTYYYVVSASNANGEGANSAQVSATPAGTVSPAPTGLTATPGNAQVTVSWTASSGATSYNVKRSTTSGGPYTTIATGITTTSYPNTGLTNGTTYYYVVSASNASGEGANSAQASATPTAGSVPSAPTGLTATPGNAQVTLSWTASSGATSYKVKRSTTSGGPYTTIATGITTTSYPNTGLTNGTTYYYVVSASNTAGESANSSQVSATPTAGVTYYSVALDGVNAWVKVNNSTSLNITGAVTVEAWIKLNSNTTAQGIVERFNPLSGAGTSDGGYALRLKSSGKLTFLVLKNSAEYSVVTSASVITTGVWHHVAGVSDGAQLKIYIDGALNASGTVTYGPASGTSNLLIGTSVEAAVGSLNGRVDEARVTSGAAYVSNFTPSYHLSSVAGTAGLWKFDGQTPNDSSPNGNNGVLKGTAAYSTDVPGGGLTVNLKGIGQSDRVAAADPPATTGPQPTDAESSQPMTPGGRLRMLNSRRDKASG